VLTEEKFDEARDFRNISTNCHRTPEIETMHDA
jgi:hypothetical protein